MPFVRHLNHITQQSKFHGPGKATAVQQVAQTEVGTHDTFQQDKRELKVELSFCSDDETLDTKGSSVPKRPLQKKARRSEPKDPGTIRNGPCTKFIPVGLVFLLVWSYFFLGVPFSAGHSYFCNQADTPQQRPPKKESRGSGLPRLNDRLTRSVVPRVECATKSVLLKVSLQECPHKNVSLRVFYQKGRTGCFGEWLLMVYMVVY